MPDPNIARQPEPALPTTPETAPVASEQPQNTNQIQGDTQASVSHIMSEEFAKATTYEDRLRAVDKIVPPLHPADAMAYLFTIEDAEREKGVIFKLLEKVEAAIPGKETERDGACVFEKTLTAPDSQLALIKKLSSEGLEGHIGPLLKHAKTDMVRKALLDKMRGPFPSDQALLEAIKDSDSKEMAKKLLDRVPEGGITEVTAAAVKDEKLGMGVNAKAKKQTIEAHKQSGPERKTLGFFGRIKGFFKSIWNFFNPFSKSSTPPPAEPPVPPEAS